MESVATIRQSTQDHRISSLPVLVVYAHSSCNCRCIMCDIWKSREGRIISVRDLQLQLASIRRLGIRWIVFSGGEPLMNPELPQLCSILREEGIRLTLLTTGLLLKKYGESVAASFDEVIVSLDGPREIHDEIRRVQGAYALLESGVRALREVRPDMRMTARSTIQKANHQCLYETACAARELQLDGISFLAVDVSSPAFNRLPVWPTNRNEELGLSLSETKILENQIERLIRASHEEFDAGFIAESSEKLRRIAQRFRSRLGLELAQAPLCNAPWVSAVVEADGTVRPCFFHAPIGKVDGTTTLEAVLNGPKGRSFRENIDIATNSVCQNCVCSLNYRF